MVTQTRNIGESFVNIVTELSLTNGTNYILQNVGARDIVLIEATSAPTSTARGHVIASKASWAIQPESGQGLYVRTDNLQSSISVTEAN